ALIRYFVEQKTDKLYVSLRLANMCQIVVRLSKFSKHKDIYAAPLPRDINTAECLEFVKRWCNISVLEPL
ncbi:hypothetical protein Bpfe_001938, partial [Biomphalaria pfeifferi]